MQIKGNAIEWEKWHLRISFNYREGLVLHNVGYVLGMPGLEHQGPCSICQSYVRGTEQAATWSLIL